MHVQAEEKQPPSQQTTLACQPNQTNAPHVPFQGGEEADAKDEGVEARWLPVLGPSPWQISAKRSLSTQARNVDEASSTSAWLGSRRVAIAGAGVGLLWWCCCCCLSWRTVVAAAVVGCVLWMLT